jgi:hypothetical protein
LDPPKRKGSVVTINGIHVQHHAREIARCKFPQKKSPRVGRIER